MIITGFEFTSQGNSAIRVANDKQTESFSLITNKNLPYAHKIKHFHLWQFSDYDKGEIESEIKAYVSEFGTEKQKDIIFGKIDAMVGNRY